jgi:transposase InsO family protein
MAGKGLLCSHTWHHEAETMAYLIHDRDPLYTHDFCEILASSGIRSVKLPPQSPDVNPYAERFVISVKYECLNHLILSSVEQLEYAIDSHLAYYHHERIHQSLGRMIDPIHQIDSNGAMHLGRGAVAQSLVQSLMIVKRKISA